MALAPELPTSAQPQLKVDRKILVIDKVICRHIEAIAISSRGAVSQDILAQLRNFVEHIMLRFYANGRDLDVTYPNICKGIEYVNTRGNLKVLRKFHDFLQIVASHYTLDEENSERVMLKYYEYLLRVKNLVKQEFNLDILSNLDKFPLDTDTNLQEYYEKIAERVNMHGYRPVVKKDKFYIQKIKPFFVNQHIYYEVTFSPANDQTSKFDRVIAFTQLEISSNYAAKFSLVEDRIEILGTTMPILIIAGWEVAIRDCEFKNFSSLIRGSNVSTGSAEQKGISELLTNSGYTLTDLLALPPEVFQRLKLQATQRAKKVVFFEDLERCREIISESSPGSNLIRYLLFHMNNKVIKGQRQWMSNSNLSGLYLSNKSIPFDNLPFTFSLIDHNPRLGDLFESIGIQGHQPEILARLVKNNTEIRGQLFTPLKDLEGFENVEQLARSYNDKLWYGHRPGSELVIEKGHIFINEYKRDTCSIIEKLRELSSSGVQNYTDSVQAWLSTPNNGVDSEEKKIALLQMFANSHVALIYGSAGTGKSTLINHISHFFSGESKLFLAQTHPAKENLRRRVTAANSTFSTIASFTKNGHVQTEYDMLVIDECSTVSNRDMRTILRKASFKLLVLVGDSYQIASIRFGNWFNVAHKFVPATSVFELTTPYRSNNPNLLLLWERVRKMDDRVEETIAGQEYSTSLDASIFTPPERDEIILCLNYDGLYGINNINRFLQENNPNPAITWGVQQYKVNDPILFNESMRFSPVIYNNMKGRIVAIEILDPEGADERIQFDIEVEKAINGIEAYGMDFELIGSAENGNSIIRFCVYSLENADVDDNEDDTTLMPFQIAYAVSIHKAQGLEYRSVKLVVSDEIDELITHSIFYTAITRAREKLKIYWSPEVGHRVLSRITPMNSGRDVALLKQIINQ